jgi:subtilisin-like proprotein convertase family protein
MTRSPVPQAFRYGATLLLALSLLPMQADGQSLDDQWHLKARSDEPAGANVRAVWPTTQGTGVVIGIVDDGLQHTHPDLSPHYSSALSHDFNFNDADPSPTTSGSCETFPGADCHGTAVAGVAGAAGIPGGAGVSGVAPLAALAGLRLIAAPESDADEANAFSHQLDAIHVLSNSWGPSDNGATLEGPGPLAEAARATAVTTGRGGKGRIFTWAAGNGKQTSDNCNFDGYANSRYVIAVGALDDSAGQAFYSEPCSAMFVTAPSSGGARGITTTDLMGAAGYEDPPGDYTSTFGGTSSATPVVSGTVALMLAQKPALTWRDVKHILRRTAFRITPLDAGWTAGLFPHNEKFGFGLIDAQAAVNMAATWTNVATELSILPVADTMGFNTIPDNSPAGLTRTVVIGSEFANFTVEQVEVIFSATHPYRGDLEVTLTSPAGVESHLATVRPDDSGNNFSAWRFGTVRHWGESAQGTWTLKVADRAAGDVGTWNSWTLRIYGTDPTQTAIVASEYFQTASGSAWAYQKNPGGSFTTTVLPGTVSVNGVPTKVFEDSDTGVREFYTSDANGVRLHQEFQPNVVIPNIGTVDLTVTFSPPIQVANEETGVGQTVNSSGTARTNSLPVAGVLQLPYSASFHIDDLETVTVPAGTFDVVRLGGTLTLNGQTSSSTNFLARNVGLVKYSDDDTTNVLTAFSLGLPLAVTKAGTGRGAVTSNPPGILCGRGCMGGFAGGTNVTLMATAAKGSVFSEWDGCNSVSGNTCTVTMSGGRAVTATFLALPKITSFTPPSGRAGRHVRISGSHLAGATEVRFNGTDAGAPTIVSATLIVTTVPSGATTGPISVTTPVGTATSADSFRVKP